VTNVGQPGRVGSPVGDVPGEGGASARARGRATPADAPGDRLDVAAAKTLQRVEGPISTGVGGWGPRKIQFLGRPIARASLGAARRCRSPDTLGQEIADLGGVEGRRLKCQARRE
jgi:hypothetical protein